MNLSFRPDGPLNTVVVNSANGYPLYHTETHNVINRTTQIKKIIPGTGGAQDLAESATKYFRFLVKGGIFSNSRTFIASNGMQYKWKRDSRDKFEICLFAF
ncbi:hypothetical protein M422DRAFT_276107 [Sphaerobolus stellatus SS14]|uniref:Uncharacterized protein n=1 Tax=Sphaerobolus stellatus (strain SS14) TaxID=990650 RepID=A0A0C9U2N6_SPHS4|nr:hypothetical protein M422DRAFT_276107 [Sphaerobolus stellatus SS14]